MHVNPCRLLSYHSAGKNQSCYHIIPQVKQSISSFTGKCHTFHTGCHTKSNLASLQTNPFVVDTPCY